MKTYQIRLYEQHANGTETLSDIMEFESAEQNPSILSLVRHLFEEIEANSEAATLEADMLAETKSLIMTEALEELRAEMNELGEVDPYTRAMNYALVILAEDDEFYGIAPELFARITRNVEDIHHGECCGLMWQTKEEFDTHVASHQDVSPTLSNLLLVEDWFIWVAAGDKVRRYTTELWSEWFDNPVHKATSDAAADVYTLANAWMVQHAKDHSYLLELRDNGTPITPAQFMAREF